MNTEQRSQEMQWASGRILFSVQDGVGVIRFNHPEKRNAMSLEMWEGFAHALQHARDLEELKVLVLTGEGSEAFVSGGDISQFEASAQTAETRAEAQRKARAYGPLLADFPRPTIACIRGYCLGGGLAVAIGAHIRIAAASSQFGIPAARLGIAYPFGGVRALTQLVGPSWARMLLCSAIRISANEAERIGLITRQVPDEALWDETMALARAIARNAPLSVNAALVTVAQVMKDPADRDMDAIGDIASRCVNSHDLVEWRRAFMKKRQPQFRGN